MYDTASPASQCSISLKAPRSSMFGKPFGATLKNLHRFATTIL